MQTRTSPPRLAARAVLIYQEKLLLVNAWPGGKSALWCAPGGGVERGSSLPDNLMREVYEECGLQIAVGAPCLVNEFHDPDGSFHQVEVFFRCELLDGSLDDAWVDPEGVVDTRRFFSRAEVARISLKPSSLERIAFDGGFHYDPLEPIQR
ncbi:NUDIX domain-containing protein [Thalassococcus lentus]|uniref:NUDIX domain-containing protein n=1 Tax=Thalassococcus lentus TaxID=1210524 RepID=A0ABT4XPI2_9RHOB|nr:NUDIX domain-containing protein [Thalassococcus lentus]MDA7423763.1 NUDIX domain-containing protein [Thalassococcus lentus]